MKLTNAAVKSKSSFDKIVKIIQNPYSFAFIKLIFLIFLSIIITLIGIGVINLIYPVGSASVIAIPMMITYLSVYLMVFLISTLFNLYMSEWIRGQDEGLRSLTN